MPPTLRTAAAAVARAGGGGLVLAVAGVAVSYLTALPIGAAQLAVWPVSMLLDAVLLVALIRLLAAWRPVPVPRPPIVDDTGERVARLSVVADPDAADRSPRTAVRRAAGLGRPVLRWVAVQLVLVLASVVMVLPFASEPVERLMESNEELALADQLAVLVPMQLVALLLVTFVALVPQRLALEGDPRVLVAAAHSSRVARTAYGPMFVIGLALLLPDLAASVAVALDRPAGIVAAALLAVPLRLLGAAVLTEIYLAGPRLDVPAEFGRRSAG